MEKKYLMYSREREDKMILKVIDRVYFKVKNGNLIWNDLNFFIDKP